MALRNVRSVRSSIVSFAKMSHNVAVTMWQPTWMTILSRGRSAPDRNALQIGQPAEHALLVSVKQLTEAVFVDSVRIAYLGTQLRKCPVKLGIDRQPVHDDGLMKKQQQQYKFRINSVLLITDHRLNAKIKTHLFGSSIKISNGKCPTTRTNSPPAW